MFTGKSFFRIFTAVCAVVTLLIGSAAFPARAYASSPITVTTGADELNHNGQCSLREAIANANQNAQPQLDCAAGSGSDTIVFAAGVGTIRLGRALPDILDSAGLTIDGGRHVTVSGNHTARVFNLVAGAMLVLQNITVANGQSTDVGGGVSNAGVLLIINSTFSGNSATNAGGGLFNAGTVSMVDSTFSGNTTPSDGGGTDNLGTITVVNSTFSNNSAGYGGGLSNNSGTATILNSTFSGNTATLGSGGALSTWNGGSTTPVTTLRNTILANSLAGGDCWNGLGDGTLIGGNNIIETTSNCGSIATLTSDPRLGTLSGSPAYYPLGSGSPAIDAGDDPTCAAAPVDFGSQNRVPRPQGPHCDIGSFELPLTSVFRSLGANDGWILESSETSGLGGTLNAGAKTFNLGDDAANRQYRAILHFDTASLPDTAVILKATLKIKRQGLVGTDPFGTHGGLRADIRNPFFGTGAGLQPGDFQAAAGASAVATFGVTPAGSWYSAAITAAGKSLISRTGTTQFRLRFSLDDNNDHVADYLKFYSGNTGATVNQPELVIEYYVP